jgi:spermidine/putrescine transport system substrate-binding protein
MTKQNLTYRDGKASAGGITRRRALQIGATGAAAAMLPDVVKAQAPVTLDVILPNVLVQGKLKEIIEQEAKVKINDLPFQSTPDSVSRVLAPGGTSRYNVVLAQTDYSRVPMLGSKAGDEKAAAYEMTKMPNAIDMADVFKNDMVTRDGKVYGIPIIMGYDSVLFNRGEVPEKDEYTQSWGMIFGDKYAGRIAWFDAPHHMLMAAGLYLGKKEPEKMTKDEINEVGRFLISQKKNVRTFFTSFAQCASLLTSGEVVAAYGPIPVRQGLQQKGVNVTNAWCKEGILSFIAALYIPKDSANQDKSHAFVNTILGPDYIDQMTPFSGYLGANKKAGASLTKEQRLAAGFGIYTGETKHYPLRLPAIMPTWVEVWSRVKSA